MWMSKIQTRLSYYQCEELDQNGMVQHMTKSKEVLAMQSSIAGMYHSATLRCPVIRHLWQAQHMCAWCLIDRWDKTLRKLLDVHSMFGVQLLLNYITTS